MENSEYLKEVKELSGLKQYILGTECKELGEQIEIRKVLALEIIAEELIIFNKNFKGLIGGSVSHSIRTMSVIGG